MSGPKSAAYVPSAAELARQAEVRALRRAVSRFRVLSDDFEALRRVADGIGEASGTSISVPGPIERDLGAAADIEAQCAELERTIAETRKQVFAEQRRIEEQRFLDYLGAMEELDVPAHGSKTSAEREPVRPGSHPAPSEPTRDRAERYLSTLSPGAELTERARALLASLNEAAPDLASLIVRDLQAEIGQINRAAKHQAKIDERLRELDIRAGAVGDTELLREIVFARAERVGMSDERVAALEGRADEAERLEAAAQSRDAARRVLELALLAEGYEVLSGFETAVPEDGVLVRRPGLDFHAWRVAVDDESIRMDVVRTTLEADARLAGTRDIEAETRICADLPAVLGRIAASGVELGRMRRLEPGDAPVKVLPGATRAHKQASTTTKQKERSQ
ncbi:hypothetical protein [Agromyces allii]|uniref:hypothetical protein n=1 Tax=Agromyces allii TaxID=393607 RepID=UPI0012FB6A06|nr:hypothetical protein [Agromyces allii]